MKRLKIYNTLGREKQIFIPLIESGKGDFVWIYTCGPTVYRTPHIGNVRAYIFADSLNNTIKNILWYKVKHIVNITDVWHLVWDWDEWEDKMDKAAKRDKITAWDVADKYHQQFLESLKLLNINSFDLFPKVTDHIQQQIDFILELEKKWFTYKISDWVYFDTSKLDDYWKLWNVGLDWMKQTDRIITSEKRNLTDFVLRKFIPEWEEKEMQRQSPWWKGFPGWHIECSSLSLKYLWKNFDIHTWGFDHIPVHHTNEIAQSEAFLWEKNWVGYWMHNKFLDLVWEKMSKSLGNVITVFDFENKWYDPLDFRYYVLSSHYSSFIDFSWEALDWVKTQRKNIIKKIQWLLEKFDEKEIVIDFAKLKNYEQFENQIIKSEFGQKVFDEMIDSILDDLNTPQLIALINKSLKQAEWNLELLDILHIILYLDEKLLKVNFYKEAIFSLNKAHLEIPAQIIALAEARKQAKLDKKFQLADELREQINWMGYQINDKADGYDLRLA